VDVPGHIFTITSARIPGTQLVTGGTPVLGSPGIVLPVTGSVGAI
jgi:hypothetical protein